MAGLGDIWHSHPLVHPVDMEVQPPRAVQPQSQDGAFWTRVQIRTKFLTDLGGKIYCLQGDQTPNWQQPPPPFTKLCQSLGFASTLAHCFSYLKSTFPFPPCVQLSSVQLLSRVQLIVTPWITAHQASLSFTVFAQTHVH